MVIVPSSSISMVVPVSSWMPRMTTPPLPITSRILSGLILILMMRGAKVDSSVREPSIAAFMISRMCRRASRAWSSATFMMSLLIASIFRSICSAVMPLLGAGDLEVHVAEVVLVAEDVGQHREAVAFLDQAHRDAGDVRLDRHAGVHQREAAAAHRGHRRGAVRFGDLGDDAHRVAELLRRAAAGRPARAWRGGRGRSRGAW